MPATHHLAQLNIGRLRAPLDDPAMAGFVTALPVVNALADAAPGFVWRLQDEETGDATGLRPLNLPDVIVNLSVWEDVETLRAFTYHSAHLEPLRRRREYFDHEGLPGYLVLWWVPAGHRPTVAEAMARLEHLAAEGPSPLAFTFREPYPPHTAPTAANRATAGR
nr:DUF3291 domain-containing protein [Micromonospora sp. DSM 115978]